MRLRASALLFVCACSSPASVKVTITTLEPRVQSLEIEVRPTAPMGMDYVDCTFTSGMRSGTCPFSSSQKEWGGCNSSAASGPCDDLTFVAFGNTGQTATLIVTGKDASNVVLTSTQAMIILPSSGTQSTLPLTLLAHGITQCSATIPPRVTGPSQTALTLIPRGSNLDIMAWSPGVVSFVSYSRTGVSCTLTTAGSPANACVLPASEPSAAVVGDLLGNGHLQIAAIVHSTGPNAACPAPGDSYVVSTIADAPNMAMPTVIPLPPGSRGSAPALADLDGDGHKELVAIVEGVDTTLSLLVWNHASAQSGGTIPLAVGTEAMKAASATWPLSPPLVYPLSNGREGLVISGYEGEPFKYDMMNGVAAFLSRTGTLIRSDSFAASLFKGTQALPTLVGVKLVTSMGIVELATGDFGGTKLNRFNQPLDASSVANAQLQHIAIGDVMGDGSKTAVVADGEAIYLFPLTGGGSPSKLMLPAAITGGYSVLLANIDGKPGAEIIATNPFSNTIYAVDHTGQRVDGFPIVVSESATPYLHVLVEDLDRDGTVEIVTLADNILRVYSLDKGSYDAAHTPWPMPGNDLTSSADNLSESDPIH
jgi:hypothetical protein